MPLAIEPNIDTLKNNGDVLKNSLVVNPTFQPHIVRPISHVK